MAGAYYIWIMAAIFLGAVFLAGLFALVFWIGHRLEKKETGAETGFLELPKEFESRPASRPESSPTEAPPPTSGAG